MKKQQRTKIVHIGRMTRETKAVSMGLQAEISNPLLRYTAG
jgi:hypothetical protein